MSRPLACAPNKGDSRARGSVTARPHSAERDRRDPPHRPPPTFPRCWRGGPFTLCCTPNILMHFLELGGCSRLWKVGIISGSQHRQVCGGKVPADTPDVETGSGVFRRTRLAAGGPRRPRGPRVVTNPRHTAVGWSSPRVQPALRRPSGASEGGGSLHLRHERASVSVSVSADGGRPLSPGVTASASPALRERLAVRV